MNIGYVILSRDKEGLFYHTPETGFRHRVKLGETIETPETLDWEWLGVLPDLQQAVYALIDYWEDIDSSAVLCGCAYTPREGDELTTEFVWYDVKYQITEKKSERIRVEREVPMSEVLGAWAFPKEWAEYGKANVLPMTLAAFSITPEPGADVVRLTLHKTTGDAETLAELIGRSREFVESVAELLYDKWVGRDDELLEWLGGGEEK